jgi:hypothetical protein
MQDREIIRVIVDCCLREKMFDKYCTVLVSKLCSYEKNHKFSLQVYFHIFTMFATYVNASEITLNSFCTFIFLNIFETILIDETFMQ